MLTKNIIAFQKGFIVTPNVKIDNRSYAMHVQSDLMQFGYMLDEEAFEQLGYSDLADIKDFHNEIIDYLKDATGGKHNYQPFYKGFPEQVMEMSEYELWANQLRYYWSGCTFEPNDWTKVRPTAFEQVKYKMITKGDEESFMMIFKNFASSGQSITPTDMNVIKWFVKNQTNLQFPQVIPFKENLCTIIAEIINCERSLDDITLCKLTTTDVLRVIVYLSGGDISLPAVPNAYVNQRTSNGYRYTISRVPNSERETFKFRNFKRKERRFLLGLLEQSNLDVRDMALKAQRWVRVGEKLHPGDFAKEFPKAYQAFQTIRNEKVVTWYGQVEKAFKQSFGVGLYKLSERPGEFLRRLDWLVRTSGQERRSKIMEVLYKVCLGSSNKVLFETYTHFEERLNPVTDRSIFIKGARKKTKLPDLPAIKLDVVTQIQECIITAFKEKLSTLESLGDCWVDPELKKIPMPTNMRSLSESLVVLIRGQRVPIQADKKTLRVFAYWYDERGNQDLDMHGFLLGTTGKTFQLGYNGHHTSTLGCYSGDVRHRRGACAEYVDINIEEAINAGYKYFIPVVHNYERGALKDVKDCVTGHMAVEFAQSNPLWVPANVTQCIKPATESRVVLSGAYDLETKEYIHLDLDWGNFSSYVRGYGSKSFFKAIESYIELPKLSLYDLLTWHVEARGRNVGKEVAGTHFLYDDFATSYEKTLPFLGV